MLAMGLDARAIAQRLGISLNTCRGYVKTMLRKLGAHSQLEAVAIASRQGLFDGRDLRLAGRRSADRDHRRQRLGGAGER